MSARKLQARAGQWMGGVLAVAAALAAAGCGSSGANEASAVAAAAPAPADGALRLQQASLKMLEVQPVAGQGSEQTAWAPARVAFMEDRMASVSVPVAARVQTVRAHAGDEVKAGDVLAVLVSADALRARHEVEAARTAHEVAAAEARRQQTMVDKGVGVDVELRAAQAKLREAAQELARAQGVARLLGGHGEGASDRVVVRAPRSGVVAERKAVPGATVEAGTELFSIGDPQTLGVVAEVFESELPGIRKGSPVQVVVPQLPHPLSGRVQFLGATLDKESRRASVVVALDEQHPLLRPGMQARVGVQLSGEREMLIPITAVLIKDESRSVVYVQKSQGDGAAPAEFEARTVSLGRPVRGMVPVLSGLQAGERIVVRGGLLLDGAASQLL